MLSAFGWGLILLVAMGTFCNFGGDFCKPFLLIFPFGATAGFSAGASGPQGTLISKFQMVHCTLLIVHNMGKAIIKTASHFLFAWPVLAKFRAPIVSRIIPCAGPFPAV